MTHHSDDPFFMSRPMKTIFIALVTITTTATTKL